MDPQENKQTPDPLDKKINAPTPAASGAGHIDLTKVLLPKKVEPGHTVDSAQRINAGALLEQEITAGTLGSDTRQVHVAEVAEVKQAAAPAPVVEETMVKPLETYQHDIESVVQHDNVSVLAIATAEANRRSTTGEGNPETKAEKTRSLAFNIAMVMGGLIFLIGASGALAYLVTRQTSVPVSSTTMPASSLITIDAVKEVTFTPDQTRGVVMSQLDAARQATSLSLGLMGQLLVTESSTTPNGTTLQVLPAQSFFTLIAPNIPSALARTFKPDYLLGVHVYNSNQAFIIANVYSYEEAYAGMLAWEPNLKQDLSPLFNYTPTQHIPEQGVATIATGTDQFIQTGFVDKIVENHDARVLQNSTGDIYLLWTFLDRNTLVITTDDATLREIISRLKNAPITPIPSAQ